MSKADMFLNVVGQKSGAIKGESEDTQHKGEIDVIGWSWGIAARQEMSGAGAAGKAIMRELNVIKLVDKASTALMTVTATHEQVKKAVLAVRKAGTTQQEYFKLTIEKGRITGIQIDTSGPQMLETISFSFQKIEVECKSQSLDGQLQGSGVFNHEIYEG